MLFKCKCGSSRLWLPGLECQDCERVLRERRDQARREFRERMANLRERHIASKRIDPHSKAHSEYLSGGYMDQMDINHPLHPLNLINMMVVEPLPTDPSPIYFDETLACDPSPSPSTDSSGDYSPSNCDTSSSYDSSSSSFDSGSSSDSGSSFDSGSSSDCTPTSD